MERIRHHHTESRRRYGAPKIHVLLGKEGIRTSINRVQRMMRRHSLRSVIVKKFRPESSVSKVEERDNVLDQDFSTSDTNEKWVGDITYIHTLRDGWCYLASVLDLHSRKIVGYSFGKRMTTDLVLDALKNAITVQQPKEAKLILHTDLGSQYTSTAFEQAVKNAGMTPSFSRKGCPYDNACIESFHATLKKEEVYLRRYVDFQTARIALFQYIESWYNRKRIHGSIDYLTPQEKEDLCRESNVCIA